MSAFLNFHTLTHLTPYTTKTYINIFTPPNGPRTTTDERRIIQNEPNFNQRAPRDERRKNEKRTQFLIYSYTHLPIHLFIQNEPNYRFNKNNKLQIINNKLKGPISRKMSLSACVARTCGGLISFSMPFSMPGK